MTDIARRNGMRFDAILGADIAQDYKPRPRVYQASAEAFDLKPNESMMVSAFSGSSCCRIASSDGCQAGRVRAGKSCVNSECAC
jgi:hypothetical protein